MEDANALRINKPKNRPASIIVKTLLVIALLGGVAGGIYYWQHSQVDNLNKKVDQLNSQMSSLQSQYDKVKGSNDITSDVAVEYKSLKSTAVKVYSPDGNGKVSSPLAVIGEVPGSWSHEASFPVKLLDKDGKVVAETNATVLGDWMTSELVPFSVQLTWPTAQSGKGTLVLQKDNPSGDTKNDDSVSIPINY